MPTAPTAITEAPTHERVQEGRCTICGLNPDLCSGTPADVLERARGFIRDYAWQCGWTFAKTLIAIPHQYAVRARAKEAGLEDEFTWFIRATKDYGYGRKFGRNYYRYLNIDGWRYWTMTGYSAASHERIINRAPLTKEAQDALREANT